MAVTERSRDLQRLRISDTGTVTAPASGMRRGWARLILAVALLGGLGVGAMRLAPGLAKGIGARVQAPEVKLVVVAMREIGVPPVILTAVGYVVPRRQITVSSNAQGKIVDMPVVENQRVEAGAVVARLDADEFKANLRLAEAQASDAKRELDLVTQLFKRGVRPQADVDRVKASYDIASARVELARVALENTVLVAPFGGTIIRKLRDVGEFLTIGVTAQGDPGTAVVTLADLDTIEVELEVSETEIGKVALGMPALVIPEARPRSRYLADVIEVAARADRRKAVVPVRVRIREPNGELLPDMTAKVRFLSEEPRGDIRAELAVPRTAIVQRGGGPGVFVVADGKAESIAVTLAPVGAPAPGGRSGFTAFSGPTPSGEDEFVAISEGPADGAFVIAAPPQTLSAGDPVRIAP